MKLTLVLFLICLSAGTIAQPRLLKDIVNESEIGTVSSYWQANTTIFKNRLYFVSNSDEFGAEIYSTDGTPEGTTLLKDIVPGKKGFTSRVDMLVVNDMLLFGFASETSGELWKTDGTSEGTEMIAPIRAWSAYGTYTVLNDVIYFASWEAERGYELWRSDGTKEGTYIVKEIFPGEENSVTVGEYGFRMIAGDDEIFFIANDGVHGPELWRSDGTTGGTALVKDIHPYYYQDLVTSFSFANGKVYFLADDGSGVKLWKSDGTEEGTMSLEDSPAFVEGIAEKMVALGDKLLFRNNNGSMKNWYVLDPATDDVSLLKESPNGISYTEDAEPALRLNDLAYFIDFVTLENFQIWETDATLENTREVFSMTEFPREVVISNGNFYMVSEVSGTDTFFLKVSSGLSTPVKYFESEAIYGLTEFNGKVFMWVKDKDDYEPWITDGTLAGTSQLQDVNQYPNGGIRRIMAMDYGVVFPDQHIYGYFDLWSSNGTESSTTLYAPVGGQLEGEVANNGQKIIFSEKEAYDFGEVWATDGTEAGTQFLTNIQYAFGDTKQRARWVGDKAFILSTYFWTSDGTTEGTSKIEEYGITLNASIIHQSFKNEFYFVGGNYLSKTDGTDITTIFVSSPDGIGAISGFIAGENKMYLIAKSDNLNWHLWTSDGTQAGTKKVWNLQASQNRERSSLQGVIGDVAYFTHPADHGMELWRSDGTEAGTFILKDIHPGPGGSYPSLVTVVGSTMYFTADDGIHGRELWKTDGAEGSTMMIKDINPGVASSSINVSEEVYGKLYFGADDGVHGMELWKTDGTGTGTTFVFDVNPGMPDGFFNEKGSMASFGNKLFFIGTESHGCEVWVFETSDGPPVTGLPGDLEQRIIASPNPATNSLTIETSETSAVCMIDILGREVLATNINQPTTLDVGNLARGVYVLHFKQNEKSFSQKIILK